jgi:cellulose synthase/poly-beta-1,6-N-acetylglucosamine synthase-like glycosyltransferase
MDFWIKTAIVAFYVMVLLAIAAYGLHRYVLVYLYLKHRNDIHVPKERYTELPKVTVQLPMFNEDAVAERIIRATCLIDYPRERLEIQVLDDSTDHSSDIARKACEEWRAKGYPVKYIHRTNREGYKAGALAAGLKQAQGELIAIFDADFVPPADILHNVVHHFTNPRIGMVQVRWDHLNRDASLLTKSQAIFLDGHFVIEHTARNRSGRFMHFNGTAGVWRRTTIDDAGGWQHDTLTEDLDLSYRAQLKGWQFVYLPQYCAPAELPPEMIAFKQQAHRWTKGSCQTAIKLLPRILKSRLPRHVKTEAFFHLTNTVVYPLMVILTLMMYPVFIFAEGPLKHYASSHLVFCASLFVLATCSASTFFVFAQRELFGREAGWKSLLYLPILMAIGVGISLNNCKAVIEAIVSAWKGKVSEFVRTPKYGAVGRDGVKIRNYSIWTFRKLALPIVEIAFGCYMSCFIFISLYYDYATASVPFLTIFAGGYFYVGFTSIYALWNMQREVEVSVPASLDEDPEPIIPAP